MNYNILNEIKLKFTTSGGPGGQNVNRTATRVELYFDVENSLFLTEDEKTMVRNKLDNRINSQGLLIVYAADTRSQVKNREIVINRFLELIKEAVKKKKVGRHTKRTLASVEKRLKGKKITSEKKKNRKKIDD